MSEARQKVSAQQVRRELLPNQSVELLKTLHLLTRDGDLNADARRKLKQVNHLVGLLQPGLEEAFAANPSPVIADVGSGNSYLGFVLYELFLKERPGGELLSVESRPDLTQRSLDRARALGFSRMRFEQGAIAEAQYPTKLDVVTALHACDTATDDAIIVAIQHQADHIALVPCCQAEVAQQLRVAKSKESAMGTLFEHPWHRREFGSHLTNVIRALVLESFGYQVTVTELAGWEHSLKNELILARKVQKNTRVPREKLEALLSSTGVRPKVIRALL